MIIPFGRYFTRPFNDNDADSLVENANNYNVSKFLRDSFPFPYSKQNAIEWIEHVKKNCQNLTFAIADENKLIGGIGAVPGYDVHRFSAEVGFWLGEKYWGKKIISQALPEFCNYLFTNFNFNRLFANVFDGNLASSKVLVSAGFILEGRQRKSVFKENKFIDLYVYGLLKEDFFNDSKPH